MNGRKKIWDRGPQEEYRLYLVGLFVDKINRRSTIYGNAPLLITLRFQSHLNDFLYLKYELLSILPYI